MIDMYSPLIVGQLYQPAIQLVKVTNLRPQRL